MMKCGCVMEQGGGGVERHMYLPNNIVMYNVNKSDFRIWFLV